MKFRVLGCSGGIGDGRHTTAFLLDDDILVDCGTGVTTLTHAEMRRIDHIFLTHAHLDHIAALPLLLDSVAGERDRPVILHALPEVLQTLQSHVFNWHVWPDFSRIPSAEAPFMRYEPLHKGAAVNLNGRELVAVAAHHVVPAVGYLMRTGAGSLLFSGDTSSHEGLWQVANATPDLRHFLVECSFEDALAEVATAAMHYHPEPLANDLRKLKSDAQVWISHLKPGHEAGILAELSGHGASGFMALRAGQIIEI